MLLSLRLIIQWNLTVSNFSMARAISCPDALEDEIEALIANDMKDINLPTGSGIGKDRIPLRYDPRVCGLYEKDSSS